MSSWILYIWLRAEDNFELSTYLHFQPVSFLMYHRKIWIKCRHLFLNASVGLVNSELFLRWHLPRVFCFVEIIMKKYFSRLFLILLQNMENWCNTFLYSVSGNGTYMMFNLCICFGLIMVSIFVDSNVCFCICPYFWGMINHCWSKHTNVQIPQCQW